MSLSDKTTSTLQEKGSGPDSGELQDETIANDRKAECLVCITSSGHIPYPYRHGTGQAGEGDTTTGLQQEQHVDNL